MWHDGTDACLIKLSIHHLTVGFIRQVYFAICGDFAISEVVNHMGKKTVRYKRLYVISNLAISENFLVTQRRILPSTKILLCYIRHLIVSDLVISGFEWTVFVIDI